MTNISKTPELAVSQWFNTPDPITLASLRGRPVFLHAFQALCPGCVSDAVPQLHKLERVFGKTDLAVVGIHTVFEHHAAMTPVTLKAFLHEYRISSPVGVDLADPNSAIPLTMQRFAFRGTPSSVLIGRNGEIISQAFGVETDMVLGARIAMALSEPIPPEASSGADEAATTCAAGVCDVSRG
jgi:thiol-disulfide isomerase/thioredoxin